MGELTKNEKKQKIRTDSDFIDSPENENSLKALLQKTTKDAISDSTIKKVLIMNQTELDAVFASAFQKLRSRMTHMREDVYSSGDDE